MSVKISTVEPERASGQTEQTDNGIFKIQADVAENVATKIGAQITSVEIETIQKAPTNNEEAYNLFVLAEFQRNKSNEQDYENAIPLYEKAIELDPNFALPYIALGSIWLQGGLVWGVYNEQEAWGNAKKMYQKAIEIDSSDSRLTDLLRGGSFYYDWDFVPIENFYQTNTFQPSPRTSTVYGDYLIKTGRSNEALGFFNKYIAFDPSLSVNYQFKAEILMHLGREDEAIALLNMVDPVYSDDMIYLRATAKLYYYLGEHEKSRKHLEILKTTFKDNPSLSIWLNAVYSQMDGNIEQAEKYLSELNEKYLNNDSGSPAWFIALYYCTLEDYETTFEWLQKSYDRHEVEMTWFREEPLLIPIQDDPHYKELYERIGFSQIDI